jgi:O-antigen ligase
MWFGVAAYTLGSPLLTPVTAILPNGSVARAVVLTLIPLIGVVVVLQRDRVRQRADQINALVAALVIIQLLSSLARLGVSYIAHAVPAVAMLLLALAARRDSNGLGRIALRTRMCDFLPPMIALMAGGWLLQLLHAIPSLYPSSFLLSVLGYRLQGLGLHPDGYGFLVATLTLLAFAAQPSRTANVARALGILSLLATNSRTALLAFAVGLLLLWILGPGWSFSRRYAALLGMLVASLFVWQIIAIRRAESADVLTGRGLVWQTLWPHVHGLPFLGYGPDYVSRTTIDNFGVYSSIYDAQNQFLSDLLQFGIVGALLTVMLIANFALITMDDYRWLIGVPVTGALLLECFSEVPLNLWASVVEVMPLFLLVLLAPKVISGSSRRK